MVLDALALIITILITIGTAVLFIWRTVIDPSMGILGKIFFGIIMTPCVTGIAFFISLWISFGLAGILNKIFGWEYDYRSIPNKSKEEDKDSIYNG